MTDEIIGFCNYILAKEGAFSVGPLNVSQGVVIFTAVMTGLVLVLMHRYRTRHDKYKGAEK